MADQLTNEKRLRLLQEAADALRHANELHQRALVGLPQAVTWEAMRLNESIEDAAEQLDDIAEQLNG